MYARIVRFTDVSGERISEIASRLENEDPPDGVDLTGLELFFDEAQSTALFVGYYDSREKMAAAAKVLEALDASDTPGSRATIDVCEIKVQRQL